MNSYELIELNTARNALKYVIRAFNIKELYMPFYICPSIRITALKENCSVKFYHIDKFFKPVCKFPDYAFILYPDYFGICSKNVDELTKKYPNLIIDNAHSFFAEPKGIASFNSLRKFFPCLRDGSFLYTTTTAHININKDDYIYEYKELSFENLCKNENRLDYEDIKYISNCTKKFFLNLDLQYEKQKFLKNFNENHNKLKKNNNLKLDIKKNDVPYKYPYMSNSIENANKFVNKLEKEGKIIFKYWNNLPDNFIEKEFYTKLVAV